MLDRAAYSTRAGVETRYREWKHGRDIPNLRSHTPMGILQEIQAPLLLSNLVRWVMTDATEGSSDTPVDLSLTTALTHIENALLIMRCARPTRCRASFQLRAAQWTYQSLVRLKGRDPPAIAGGGVAPSGRNAGLVFALGALDGEAVEAELAMDNEVVSAVGIGADDVEIGGGGRRSGAGRRRREPTGEARCHPNQDEGRQAVGGVTNGGSLPCQPRLFTDGLDPRREMLAHDRRLLADKHEPFGEPIGSFLGHADVS